MRYPWVHGTIGVEAAAQFYFGKPVQSIILGRGGPHRFFNQPGRGISVRSLILMSPARRCASYFRKFVETGVMSVQEAEKEYALLETNYYSKIESLSQ